MTTKFATVVKVLNGNLAEVTVQSDGIECETCPSCPGCTAKRELKIKALNFCNAQVGEKVKLKKHGWFKLEIEPIKFNAL